MSWECTGASGSFYVVCTGASGYFYVVCTGASGSFYVECTVPSLKEIISNNIQLMNTGNYPDRATS